MYQRDKLTVILPVYRSLPQLKCCIESLVRSFSTSPFRLLVIYDCGPEPEVLEYLRECRSQYDYISLVENDENLGFVKSVNIAFRKSLSGDVVILNSDTVVGPKWLEKLLAAADSDPSIGTITPLSNNAEICSFPSICTNNKLPRKYTVDVVDQILEETLPANVFDIPTAVGFCMYIRGQALEEVGLFDEQAFGLGYGEENDLCQRIAAAGFRNVVLINTWVHHEGGVSFGSKKAQLMEKSAKIIQQRYPNFFINVHQFIANDPLRSWRLLGVLALLRAGPLPTILLISHGLGGGTGRHLRELSRYTQQDLNSITLEPIDRHRVKLQLPTWAWQQVLVFDIVDNFEMLLHFLAAAGLRLIHIHHIKGLETLIEQLLDRLGLPHLITLHDYYLIGGNSTLSDEDAAFNPERAFDEKHRCRDILSSGTLAPNDWDSLTRRLVYGARQVIAPDASVAEVFLRCFPGLTIMVTPHPDAERWNCYPHIRARIEWLKGPCTCAGRLEPRKGRRSVGRSS